MQLKKLFAALAVSGGLVFTLAGCGDKAPAEKTAAPAQTAAVELKIGVSPVPHADIINFVAPTLEKVLETAGILKVRPEAGILASPADIVDNPKHVKIVEVEAAQLPRALDDVDAAVINSNYALAAKLNPTKDAIAIESKDSPYANVVVVRAGDENRPELQKLKNALLTPEVKKFLEEKYQGAVVPAF